MNPRTLREKLYRVMKGLPSAYIVVIILPAAICLYLYSAHFQAAGFCEEGKDGNNETFLRDVEREAHGLGEKLVRG